MRFVDSHLHLDTPDAVEAASPAEDSAILLFGCGVDRKSSLGVLEASRKGGEWVRAFVGVHPSEAEKEPDLGWLEWAASSAAGVGEVGLDPTYSDAGPDGAQMVAFTESLRAAEKLGKPVQVHSRQAEGSCLEVLGGFRLKGVLMHWLDSENALPMAMERGYFVSFGPALLYSKRLQRMAKRADPSLVLTESDSPVGYTPLGGVRGPTLIPSVVFRLAELWGTGFEEARKRTVGNAVRYLGGPEKG